MSTPAEPYPYDPDAPYFETLYSAARMLSPNITREQLLTILHNEDPADTLRIREPIDPTDYEDNSEAPCPNTHTTEP